MSSSVPCLITYSVVTTVITVTLGILYHNCGSDDLENNHGIVDQRTEIGLIYDEEECKCDTTLTISVLESLVMLVLICMAIRLMVKVILQAKDWWKAQREKKRERKEKKSHKLKREMIAEYRKGIEAENDPKEPTV